MASGIAASVPRNSSKEDLPTALDASSEPPALFDGTTRLYTSYNCPYAQRVWIARNYKGLQDEIKLVPINLRNRPAWYKEKIYFKNKVPSLEHNNDVRGESLDLLRYLEDNFEGLPVYPNDPEKKKFAEELMAYSDSFNSALYKELCAKGDLCEDVYAALDKIEESLAKFDDGPFFLGQFSVVDIVYAPFIERYQIFLTDVKNYDITYGRPKLTLLIEELNKIDSYNKTRQDPQELIRSMKKSFGIS